MVGGPAVPETWAKLASTVFEKLPVVPLIENRSEKLVTSPPDATVDTIPKKPAFIAVSFFTGSEVRAYYAFGRSGPVSSGTVTITASCLMRAFPFTIPPLTVPFAIMSSGTRSAFEPVYNINCHAVSSVR